MNQCKCSNIQLSLQLCLPNNLTCLVSQLSCMAARNLAERARLPIQSITGIWTTKSAPRKTHAGACAGRLGRAAMAGAITGSCLCGALNYQVQTMETLPELEANYCHCTQCRRATGAQLGTFVTVPRSTFLLTGSTLKCFQSSSHAHRAFCSVRYTCCTRSPQWHWRPFLEALAQSSWTKQQISDLISSCSALLR